MIGGVTAGWQTGVTAWARPTTDESGKKPARKATEASERKGMTILDSELVVDCASRELATGKNDPAFTFRNTSFRGKSRGVRVFLWFAQKPRAMHAGLQERRPREKLSGCFPPLLNGLQRLAVLLRIAHDLALRQAVDPQLVRDAAAFAACANGSSMQDIARTLICCLLQPAAARAHG